MLIPKDSTRTSALERPPQTYANAEDDQQFIDIDVLESDTDDRKLASECNQIGTRRVEIPKGKA